ncbi:PmoA family protein [Phytohabitans sp. ZYX-F-186]|uniref:PmoA family protein n=1 Tax=Phytohabitans maris TaxID=3071409 RepID=A0ABU0ZWL2_9ACTN|nr:PmoA family protein [Phytohabitans sp. ZYX-F-186]MDQ7911428.1 PmoA family protein [Phytohabitans sp. ZYX-F-186]
MWASAFQGGDMVELRVAGRVVAEYVVEPDVDPKHGPRPYLHPVRTLGGTTVTDVLPEDHRWHLGVSVALQDVNGTNLWGGRTYVRDAGYTWLDDHGRIAHEAWLPPVSPSPSSPVGPSSPSSPVGTDGPDGQDGTRLAERLLWLDPAGETLLVEERTLVAAPASRGWTLDVAFTLTAPPDAGVTLGSPATNGRPGGAGYGGFFWRLAPGLPDVFTSTVEGEEKCNGSTDPWLAVRGEGYTLVFTGLAGDDHWFVRAADYPGVCAALAWEHPLAIPAGGTLSRRYRVLVADGALDRETIQ